VAEARRKAFDSDLCLHILTADCTVDGPSGGVGISLSLVATIFGIGFKQDVVVTGELAPSGLIYPVWGQEEKAVVTFQNAKKTLASLQLPRQN